MDRFDAIYARQSIDKADSISIESQVEFCKYETRGASYQVFKDKGYSGKNTDRPEFQKMLSEIRIGRIKRVICYKLDRCSRSILDFTTLMEEFQKYNVEFISCTEKFDTSSPMGRAMLNICIVFAQLERETIQQRVTDAYYSRNKRGFFMGGKIPFGFKLEPFLIDGKKTSRYTEVSNEVEILKLMYSVYEKPTTSLADVAVVLADAGIKNPRRADGKWTRTHIGRMLKNPIYVKADLNIYRFYHEAGVTVHNRPEDFIGTYGCYLYTEAKTYNCDGDRKVYHLVVAPHDGIVSSDVWLRCRQKRKYEGKTIPQNRSKNTWLAGKLKCAKCGYAMVVHKSIKKEKEYRYLVCSTSNEGYKKCEGVHGLKAGILEELVFSEMKKRMAALAISSDPENDRIESEIARIRIRIMELEEEINQAADKSLEASGALMKYLSNRVDKLDSEKSLCLRQAEDLECQVRRNTQDEAFLLKRWEIMELTGKKLVVNELIDKISVSENKVTIYWRI